MSDDLISRQAAIAACQTIIRELPSVQPKTGQWVYGEFDIPHCSECGMEVMPCDISKYCPNCGARMEGN